MFDKNIFGLFNFDGDGETDLYSTAMDIAAMGLKGKKLEDELSLYGLTTDYLKFIGADLGRDAFDYDDDFDSDDDFDTDDDFDYDDNFDSEDDFDSFDISDD